ncbi:glycosyl hydrolase family 18 protein [Chryseolinea lacunae]|uniref:chitinase n=1 Tax=Chryseolinea lacunae TaxID=2801331 RepID=A0ABS1KYA7_9BACT|nr:glycosyl hydrolase family 18 protein [Chryseolinea lacunae]MBL0744434.1 T9SS type A sorting domain-containing protein [Chryseolinea lacunae]
MKNKFKIMKAGILWAFMLLGGVASAQLKVVGYVGNEDPLVSVDYSRVTHLNMAFVNPTDAAGTLSFTNWQQSAIPMKTQYVTSAHAQGRKVLASLAGGTASENAAMRNRYFNLISDANRAGFVQKIVDFVKNNNLDGIDVDLEGAAINADYGKFVIALCNALQPQGKLVTAALSHLNGAANVPTDAMNRFDFLNIMAYDRTGPWNPSSPGQHASFDFAEESVNYWTARGLAPSKCILGVPFYGYSFGADNTARTYAYIVDNFPGAENKDDVTANGTTIYYNGTATIQQKAQYVKDHELGGIMIWNVSQDKPSSDTRSLLRAIDDVLKISSIVTDAADERKENSIKVFPNPASSLLTIKAGDDYRKGTIRIVDSMGTVRVYEKYSGTDVDVSSFSPGAYLVLLENGSRSATVKFVRQ